MTIAEHLSLSTWSTENLMYFVRTKRWRRAYQPNGWTIEDRRELLAACHALRRRLRGSSFPPLVGAP